MASKRQQRAARMREQNRKDKEREEQELRANALRLKTMSSGLFNVQGTTTGRVSMKHSNESNEPQTKSSALRDVSRAFHRETPDIPSHVTNNKFSSGKERYVAPDEEMAKREALAQHEISNKRKQVGILVNKSGYQYLTPGMDLTTLGKK